MKIGKYTVESCGDIRAKHALNCIIELGENGLLAEAYDEILTTDCCRELRSENGLRAEDVLDILMKEGYQL